jgi:hypothetical protein
MDHHFQVMPRSKNATDGPPPFKSKRCRAFASRTAHCRLHGLIPLAGFFGLPIARRHLP